MTWDFGPADLRPDDFIAPNAQTGGIGLVMRAVDHAATLIAMIPDDDGGIVDVVIDRPEAARMIAYLADYLARTAPPPP